MLCDGVYQRKAVSKKDSGATLEGYLVIIIHARGPGDDIGE